MSESRVGAPLERDQIQQISRHRPVSAPVHESGSFAMLGSRHSVVDGRFTAANYNYLLAFADRCVLAYRTELQSAVHAAKCRDREPVRETQSQ